MFKEGINVIKLDQGEIIQVGDKRDTAKLVEEFYSDNPFPNYDNLETIFDLRKNSKSFLKAQSFYLSEKKNEMLYIPEGVAHGYLTLTNNTELMYFHSNIYNKKSSMGINIMDNNVKFKLKKKIKIISSRDKKLKFLNDL